METGSSLFTNPMFVVMLSIIALLLLVIYALGQAVLGAGIAKSKEQRKDTTTSSGIVPMLALLVGLSLPGIASAQSAKPVAVAASAIWGLDTTVFYLLLTVIALEVLIIWMLYIALMRLIGQHESHIIPVAKPKQRTLIEKLNASVSLEREAEVMTDHEYDGIRELDNNLPPWWIYGFYFTIVFAVVYMIHYHLAGTGKLQLAEYDEQLAEARHEAEEFRKKSANLIDENSATMLTDAGALASGKKIFDANCAACHGKAGEGLVGPNLTDDYWLYKGGIGDIFKTIKYGKPEKGMKAWQQDLGAKQIHEVSSYIRSLKGTNPPNPKEKQGELYTEEGKATTDSTQTSAGDTSQVAVLRMSN